MMDAKHSYVLSTIRFPISKFVSTFHEERERGIKNCPESLVWQLIEFMKGYKKNALRTL